MADSERQTVVVGSGADARAIAVLRRPGKTPGLFWLGGFRSDMTGSKAMALDALGARLKLGVTRFDYSGHGASGDDFAHGTISRWLEEALAVFGRTRGPQIVIGSSMGGWLALLLARAVQRRGSARLAGMVLIAPAVDMTEALMWAGFSPEQQVALQREGVVIEPSAYDPAGYPITRALIEDGRQHLLFGNPIEPGCPVAILQGGQDPDVPQAHAEKLMTHLISDPATLTIVPDGDHRLSRPQDLALLERTVERLVSEAGAAV